MSIKESLPNFLVSPFLSFSSAAKEKRVSHHEDDRKLGSFLWMPIVISNACFQLVDFRARNRSSRMEQGMEETWIRSAVTEKRRSRFASDADKFTYADE